MPDRLTIEQRHANMAAIRGKDTKPEMIVRKYLWAHGFRYRLNHPRLPGKPDVVLRKYKTCIFVNGCFWHGHKLNIEISLQTHLISHNDSIQDSQCCKIPHTNREFWVNKILNNKSRDLNVRHKLAEMGWHCITIWECELKHDQKVKTLESLAYTLNHIYLQDHSIHKISSYSIPEDEELSMAAEEIHFSQD